MKAADGSETELEGFKGAKTQENGYSNNFQSFAHDVNNDGWADYVVVSFPGKETFWFENPKGGQGEWAKHVVWTPTDNESPMLTDINGDGLPDLLCMSNGHLGFATYDAKPPPNPGPGTASRLAWPGKSTPTASATVM
ncbi:FG-GAP repeat domain-containing protein [Verrucomicrobium spinosum]|uniref:FG-GAP repeat domain-containing protein n=1 Tax=Verrucomicrobium spinosum TaxID=2736 RepID=UPI0009461E8B|nr:VCBS repeat-containing protein [Verrucomicrobium spinosum]